MFFSILSSGEVAKILLNLLLTVPVIFIALSFHEAAHAFVAYKMGDRSVKALGRVTLNPFRHLDVLGCIWMFIFGYGWAKPTPINVGSFKKPSKALALTAIAGPIANLILGCVGTVFFALISHVEEGVISAHGSAATLMCLHTFKLFFYFFGMINFTNAVINLVPVPPFDGSKFLRLILPQKVYLRLVRYEKYSLVAVTLISFLCFRFFSVSPATWVAEKLFNVIVDPISAILDTLVQA